jgi:hypothetical protein
MDDKRHHTSTINKENPKNKDVKSSMKHISATARAEVIFGAIIQVLDWVNETVTKTNV